MMLVYSFLNLLCVFFWKVALNVHWFWLLLTILFFQTFSRFQNFFMFFVHKFHFFFLVLSSHFFSSTFNIFNVRRFLSLFSSLSFFFSMGLFGHILRFLILILPRYWLDIYLTLLKWSYTFPKYFFHPRNSKQEKGISNHSKIYIFEFENVFQLMLLISSNIGNKSSLTFFYIVTITSNNLINSFWN